MMPNPVAPMSAALAAFRNVRRFVLKLFSIMILSSRLSSMRLDILWQLAGAMARVAWRQGVRRSLIGWAAS